MKLLTFKNKHFELYGIEMSSMPVIWEFLYCRFLDTFFKASFKSELFVHDGLCMCDHYVWWIFAMTNIRLKAEYYRHKFSEAFSSGKILHAITGSWDDLWQIFSGWISLREKGKMVWLSFIEKRPFHLGFIIALHDGQFFIWPMKFKHGNSSHE